MKMKALLFAIPILLCFAAKSQTFSSSGSITTIGSATCGVNDAGVSSAISVSATGKIADPTKVTISMNLSAIYTFFSRIVLYAPDGDSCILLNFVGRSGGCGGSVASYNAANTLSFNSSYTTAITPAGSAIATGNYAPTGNAYDPGIGNLSTFLAGKSVNGNWSLRATNNYVSAFNVTVSSWQLSFGATALPLDLLSFTGRQTANGKTFIWKTASEQDTKTFELERSIDGNQFAVAGTVPAIGMGDHTYSFTDDFNTSNVILYRLKIVDLNGTSKYSNTIQFSGEQSVYQPVILCPNPGKDQIRIGLGSNNELINTNALVVDMIGKPLQTVTITSDNQPIDITAYPAGTYMIRFANGEVKSFCKIN